MPELTLYNEYSRHQVHDIFAPHTTFRPQAGTWGLQGVVRIPDRPDDWVFFVTLGKSQGNYAFDEGITVDGVLTWQSQPNQHLDEPRITEWINQDELTNSIYLFFRSMQDRNYAYLGRLKYLTHDRERERPVHFQWQILEWNISADRLSELGISLSYGPFIESQIVPVVDTGLIETPPPTPSSTIPTGESPPAGFKVERTLIIRQKMRLTENLAWQQNSLLFNVRRSAFAMPGSRI